MWKGLGCAAIWFAFLSSSLPAHDSGWEKLENCRFVEGGHSDGDSIEAEYRGQRYVFRLYFVDAIEKNPQSRSRRAGQAKYFDLKGEEAEAKALQAAYAASDFTRERLKKPFTVYTRWDKVDPRGDNPSLRAFVTTADGRDLSTQLVAEGLAIIRNGRRSVSDHPEGASVDEMLRDLRLAETGAHLAGRGAWVSSRRDIPAARARLEKVQAGDRKTLLSLAGHKARVQGRVSRIGSLPDGRITFINFEGNEREDFVAIVREGSLPALKKQFPDGLDQALTGREVTIEGLVTLFRDTPQIEIENPAQISVAPEPAKR